MRARTAIALLTALLLLHLGVAAAHVARKPEPVKTFHDHDTFLVQHALVLRGEKWGRSLPVAELVPVTWPGVGPADLWRAAIANSPTYTRSYRTATPITYLLTSALPWGAGVSVWTVRLGPVLLLWLMLGLVFDVGRRIGGRPASGLAAAALLGAFPAVHQGALVGVPALGNMLGVTLALWALVRSDGLARLGWAALAGAAVALSPRWGESVGDGLECLVAVIGSVAVVAVVPAARLLHRKTRLAGARGLAGLALGAAVADRLLDRWWLETHLERYVLEQAGVGGGGLSWRRVAGMLDLAADNLPAYREVLEYSLVGPLGLGVAGVGAVVAGLRLRPRWPVWMIAASVGSTLGALCLSAKGQDTYAVGLLPALALVGGVGLAAAPSWVGVSGVSLVGVAFLAQANVDTDALADLRCRPLVSRWLLADPYRCDRLGPTPAVYHWFREWRREPGWHDTARHRLGLWATEGPGREWVAGLPSGALVLLQRPPGPGGGADVLALLLQSERPDIHVHTVLGMGVDDLTARLVADHDDVHLITLVQEMSRPGGTPQLPLSALDSGEPVERTELLHRYSIRTAGASE